MKLVNRSALSVSPTQAFVDWINSLEATDGDDDLMLKDIEQESTVYLIPEMDTEDALHAYVRERYSDILENELSAWEEDAQQWPAPRNWALFQEFIQYQLSYLALDLEADTPLDSDEMGEDFVSSEEDD
ncbi:hypothetical protein [Larsenimonas rhizosphaerae]|uniref:VacJ n=1 Tax=Larsenimonas rhizosphaerae TaxID=2944682 RepID=A0AA42CYD1_9GAMM|nr:hypothetical protein [Larsenimonas rhizosphaerae]MCM2131669.1 hypothetical protein [Larsenimonas rhizosphaerae]MCX2525005.1 hypothetical protein [Larsenimonas rhizosphaerae]